MRKHTKIIMAAVIVFFMLSCFAGYGLYARSGRGGEHDYAVAKINGKRVMRSNVDRLMVQIAEQSANSGTLSEEDWLKLRQVALDSMAVQMELEKEIKNRKIEIDGEEIEAAYTKLMDSYPTREAFKESLERSGTKERTVKDGIRTQMLRERAVQMLISEINVSEEELEEFYELTKEFLFKRDEGYMINIALFRSKEAAEKAQAAVAAGAGWDAVLDEHKADLLSSTPYDEPTETAELLMQDNWAIVKDFNVDQITPVIEAGDDRFAIVIKRSKTEARTLPFEEAKQQTTDIIRNQRAESVFEGLLARAKLEILDASAFPGSAAETNTSAEQAPDTSGGQEPELRKE